MRTRINNTVNIPKPFKDLVHRQLFTFKDTWEKTGRSSPVFIKLGHTRIREIDISDSLLLNAFQVSPLCALYHVEDFVKCYELEQTVDVEFELKKT